MKTAELSYDRFDATDGQTDVSAETQFVIYPLESGLTGLERNFKTSACSFSSSPHWVRHWATHVNSKIVVVTASVGGREILTLPLEITKKSGLTVAQYVGGSHANANFPLMTGHLSTHQKASFLSKFSAALKAAPWSCDAIILERQLSTLGAYQNPFVGTFSSISPNVSLHLEVTESFDAVLEARSAKRKRKRFRSQQRKFETAGGYEVVNPAPSSQAKGLLTQYFNMKAQQLSAKGVSNVFGNPREQAFFKALFCDEHPNSDHQFYLSALNVGGKTRAIYGSSLHGSRQMVHFTAFSDDELTPASPGDFLNYALIEAACGSNTTIYDLGVGDESYKRSWCDVETWHHDTIIGLSLRGKLAKLQFDGTNSAKRWIKTNNFVWNLVKRVRKFKGGQKSDKPSSAQTEDGSEL